MLKIKNITQIIANKKILSSISLKLEEGVFYALIGANGAGKSTLIKTITGAYPSDIKTSEIKFFNSNDQLVKEKFSYIPEWEMFSPHQKVINFLREIGSLRKIPKNTLQAKIKTNLEKFNLWEFRHRKIRNLSSGMRKKLLFIAAFLHDPKLIILDEPFANLDPPTKIEIIEFLRKQKTKKITFLISSHMLNDIESLIDQVIFIEKGKIIKNKQLDKTNHVVIISNNLPVICKYLQNLNVDYHTDGISKIYFKLDIKSDINEFIGKAYQLKNNKIINVKINDLEHKYFSQYFDNKEEK